MKAAYRKMTRRCVFDLRVSSAMGCHWVVLDCAVSEISCKNKQHLDALIVSGDSYWACVGVGWCHGGKGPMTMWFLHTVWMSYREVTVMI